MKRIFNYFLKLSVFFILCMYIFGCASGEVVYRGEPLRLDPDIAEKCRLETGAISNLLQKPLYEFSEKEVDSYLRYLSEIEPEPAKRAIHLGQKNIGQPYEIFLMGEFPFEVYDPQPLYSLSKSDCLTFCEHVYAMSLAYDWRSFFAFLQRIRYKDGEIGVATRNHYTTADWDRNNSWLIRDVTEDIAGKDALEPMTMKTGRENFFKKWGIAEDMEEAVVETEYIPWQNMAGVLKNLEDADFVNVIMGTDAPEFCGHVGMIVMEEDSPYFLHSTPPEVTKEPLEIYMKRKIDQNPERKKQGTPVFYGFRFFRMRYDAIPRLRALDGREAPLVTAPRGTLLSKYRHPGWKEPRAELSSKEKKAAEEIGLDSDYIAILKARPLYEFDEKNINDYLGWLFRTEPSLNLRLRHLAQKSIGMPYQIYLLGEFPFELHDDAPLYAIHKGDCVVFSEHMFAMALSKSWEEFFVYLQRLRFRDGEIGVLTRNHFTVADWDQNNSWLLEDISKDLAGDGAEPMTAGTRRSSFFKSRYGIDVDMEDIKVDTWFVPAEKVEEASKKLQNGDFVNVIYGRGKGCWASHVGLITIGDDGTVNFLHATRPRVKEQPLLEYNEQRMKANRARENNGAAPFRGFKFLRLRENPLEELQKIDGPNAPVVTAPLGVPLGPGRRWTPEP